MKKTQKQSSLDSLQTGIKQLLVENRCPFSEADRKLLEQCSEELQRLKELEAGNKEFDFDALCKLIELLSHFFGLYEAAKHLL